MMTTRKQSLKMVFLTIGSVLLAACTSVPSAGPGAAAVEQYQEHGDKIRVLDLNATVVNLTRARSESSGFAEVFGDDPALAGYFARPGDVLEVSIWEAPPATLFASGGELRGIGGSRGQDLPEQVVASDGTINVPFAGQIPASGRSTKQIEAAIASRLAGKANQPQVLVRILRNNSSTVTVVGEVRNAARLPLTPGKERLLDALAAVGGPTAPVVKTSIQLARGNQARVMALDAVIRDPRQNVPLMPGDIITALSLNQSFTVLGAANRNEEINFEASGITLAQALGRIGGLQDGRSDARGLFIFRFEDPMVVGGLAESAYRTADGRVPVIYRVDMKNPSTFFVAQHFQIKDKDVLYVANATGTELQKFLNLILSGLYPVFNIYNMTK